MTRYQLIDEFARLRDVPVMKAGTHNGETFDDARLERMAAAANACQPYIQESITIGAYRDNPEIVLTKPIPGIINLNHQLLLPETFKDAVKGATMRFKTAMIDGVKWLVATFDGLKADVAHFLAAKHPFRSVEIIPSLNVNGTRWEDVVRSVGFLSPDMPPAVSGQTPRLLAEYAESGVKIIISEFAEIEAETTPEHEQHTTEENNDMGTKKDEAQPVSVSEFMEMQELVKALQEQLAAMQATLAAATEEKAEMEAEKIAIEEEAKKQLMAKEGEMQANDAAAQAALMAKEEELKIKEKALEAEQVKVFCERLIHEYHAAPAFLSVAKPLIDMMDANQIKEFAGGNQMTPRAAMQEALTKILELSRKDALVVPVGEYAAAEAVDAPESQPLSKDDHDAVVIASYMDAAKARAKDPTNEREVYVLAFALATQNGMKPAAN